VLEAHNSVSTVAGITLPAIVVLIAVFSLPVLTKLKVGAVELEMQSTSSAVRELLVNPERRPEFALVHTPEDLSVRLVRERGDSVLTISRADAEVKQGDGEEGSQKAPHSAEPPNTKQRS
jgi:hypothetical protein